MHQNVNLYTFREAFRQSNRTNFSYEGLGLLFEHLEAWEDGGGQSIELDVVALCCDFSEDSPEDIADQYAIDIEDCEDEEELAARVKEYIEDNSTFVGETSTGHFLYVQF